MLSDLAQEIEAAYHNELIERGNLRKKPFVEAPFVPWKASGRYKVLYSRFACKGCGKTSAEFLTDLLTEQTRNPGEVRWIREDSPFPQQRQQALASDNWQLTEIPCFSCDSCLLSSSHP